MLILAFVFKSLAFALVAFILNFTLTPILFSSLWAFGGCF
jgi:hypothetical protein